MKKIFTFAMLLSLSFALASAQTTLDGDMNHDGVLNTSDVTLLIEKILNPDPEPVTHEYVDLALPSGVLWATCNIGAENPEDGGLFFAWGETVGYSAADGHTFDWINYQLCDSSETTMTKYCTKSNYGVVDSLTVLEAADDAATVNWGSEWRMPTKAEFVELVNKEYTTSAWTEVNGVYGCKITSNTNGNSIFIPAAGFINGTELKSVGTWGFVWSSTLYASSYSAWGLLFGGSAGGSGSSKRNIGRSVRPVRVAQ